VRVDGRNKGALPGQVVLAAGRHEVALTRSGQPEIGLGRVSLLPGERLAFEQLVRESKPAWRAGVSGGVLALTGRSVARQTVRPIPHLGVFLERKRVLGDRWTLRTDLRFGRSSQTTSPAGTPQEQTTQAFSLGTGLLHELGLGPVLLQAGPHLELAGFTRSFELPELHEQQSLVTVLPGVLGSLRVRLSGFDIGLTAELHYLPLVLDGTVHSTATGVAALTFGRSF